MKDSVYNSLHPLPPKGGLSGRQRLEGSPGACKIQTVRKLLLKTGEMGTQCFSYMKNRKGK